MPTISIIRVLQYIGTADWVHAGLARRAVKGSHVVPGGGVIREALLGDPFELISTPAHTAVPDGFGLRAPSSSKPTWDAWVDNELAYVASRRFSRMISESESALLHNLLKKVRDFANTP